MADAKPLLVLLGNQLFPPRVTDDLDAAPVFMAEDLGLCTFVRHHQHKILLFLAAMRSHADALRDRGRTVHYTRLDDPAGDDDYESKLAEAVKQTGCDRLVMFEIEDKFMEKRIEAFADDHGLGLEFRDSPMFLTPRDTFAEYLDDADGKPFMATFYKQQRRRLDLLMKQDGKPRGGRWSFDGDNRKKLPQDVDVPEVSLPGRDEHVDDLIPLVKKRFADHPGDAEDFWLPTTRRQALAWLRQFLERRFAEFGPYEDAISNRTPFLFHSVISPVINLGLITPDEIIERAVDHAREHDIPINSLEGFVRQVIGWREFIRGIYQHFSEEQEQENFFNHQRKLTEAWWTGDTGIPPLDDAIDKAQRWGWTHHIDRLMVLGNLMLLCEVEPREAHRWFMEMFVDSSDWVMGPNVYGMGIFSDGGIFATKPYICGSNYLRKMSDYKPGPVLGSDSSDDWCDVVDGLYWRFVDKHRDYFNGNARMSVMVRSFDKLKDDKRKRIFAAAERFLDRVTTGG